MIITKETRDLECDVQHEAKIETEGVLTVQKASVQFEQSPFSGEFETAFLNQSRRALSRLAYLCLKIMLY